ncbi:hypothetical protein JYT72_01165 [Crocinitomix catalasitica]|nr:hypothetical protein [Crocinitomix catalasitica]
MKEKNKIRIGFAALFFVISHTLLICIYAAPPGVVPERLKTISSAYVYPIFDQRWGMFAPCPLHDHEVELKYVFEDGDSTEWIKPNESAIKYHRWLRGSHHGELILAEYNLLFWVHADVVALELEYDKKVPNEKRAEFFEGYSYFMAKRYAYGNAYYLYDKEPVYALMKCHFLNIKTGEAGYIILPEFKWEKLMAE